MAFWKDFQQETLMEFSDTVPCFCIVWLIDFIISKYSKVNIIIGKEKKSLFQILL